MLTALNYSRQFIIVLCCHLYKLRVRAVGINELLTVYANRNEETQPWTREITARMD